MQNDFVVVERTVNEAAQTYGLSRAVPKFPVPLIDPLVLKNNSPQNKSSQNNMTLVPQFFLLQPFPQIVESLFYSLFQKLLRRYLLRCLLNFLLVQANNK